VRWPPVIREWGSSAGERVQPFPCDRLMAAPDDVLFRAVSVEAPTTVVFRWLCQLRAAPYSYDRLDNWGRRSPQTLTPGLDGLQAGQRFMTIFRLVEFEPGRSITLWHEGGVFGRVACSYRVEAVGAGRSRLVVKLLCARSPRRPIGALTGLILAPGDLLMMRRQLLNLKRLAES